MRELFVVVAICTSCGAKSENVPAAVVTAAPTVVSTVTPTPTATPFALTVVCKANKSINESYSFEDEGKIIDSCFKEFPKYIGDFTELQYYKYCVCMTDCISNNFYKDETVKNWVNVTTTVEDIWGNKCMQYAKEY